MSFQSWDSAVRDYCNRNNIIYQGFWLLTGNRKFRETSIIKDIALAHGKTVEQVLIKFLYEELGLIVLTGTKSSLHMEEDLTVSDWNGRLSNEESAALLGVLPFEPNDKNAVTVFFTNNHLQRVHIMWKNPTDGR